MRSRPSSTAIWSRSPFSVISMILSRDRLITGCGSRRRLPGVRTRRVLVGRLWSSSVFSALAVLAVLVVAADLAVDLALREVLEVLVVLDVDVLDARAALVGSVLFSSFSVSAALASPEEPVLRRRVRRR